MASWESFKVKAPCDQNVHKVSSHINNKHLDYAQGKNILGLWPAWLKSYSYAVAWVIANAWLQLLPTRWLNQILGLGTITISYNTKQLFFFLKKLNHNLNTAFWLAWVISVVYESDSLL